ncbi:hypothetical protein EMPS_01384 [Entomortierella parvispora]|uniref:Uncharacterized protein n=1 Tax=Entomortierella parvispora TaxID=205924 RepID=A0A9P3LSJ4_9FUNG|nr:hypothetical protein EMPS_01384 [Entomortierella parvispora]
MHRRSSPGGDSGSDYEGYSDLGSDVLYSQPSSRGTREPTPESESDVESPVLVPSMAMQKIGREDHESSASGSDEDDEGESAGELEVDEGEDEHVEEAGSASEIDNYEGKEGDHTSDGGGDRGSDGEGDGNQEDQESGEPDLSGLVVRSFASYNIESRRKKPKKKPPREKKARLPVINRHLDENWVSRDVFPQQFAEKTNLREKEELEDSIGDFQFQKDQIQYHLFRLPRNSHSKLHDRNAYGQLGFEKPLSSDPNNPLLDTTDSELDEIESDLELEREYEEYRAERDKPVYQLEQDGDVCIYCKAFVPFDMRKAKPYPTVYQCARCIESQTPHGPVSKEALQAHVLALKESKDEACNIEKGSFSDVYFNLKELHAGKEDMTNQILDAAEKLQPLSPKQSILWNDAVENLKYKDVINSFPFASKAENAARYWSTRGPLVVAGMVWTKEESDLFFSGLRRFGKHNVWALQEHIKSRSLAEVVAIIQEMDAEVARLKADGSGALRLNEMPMAEEVDDEQIELEEQCASTLLDMEMRQSFEKQTNESTETRPEIVKLSSLFNLKLLCNMSSRLYMQNHGAGIERDVVPLLYDSLKKWLTPIVQELVTLQHERQRVGLVLNKATPSQDLSVISEKDVLRTLHARQLPLDAEKFIGTLPMRLNLRVFDDTKSKTNSIILPEGEDPGIGRTFYLNHEVDQAQAQAPDSDQDMDTDDGVSAEEESEISLEYPLAVIPKDMLGNPLAKPEDTAKYYRKQEGARLHWDLFWSTKSRQARKIWSDTPKPMPGSRFRLQERKRFRETHPLKPTPLPFNDWKEGVERLAANSFALPVGIGKDAPQPTSFDPEDPSVLSMNKRKRNHEQLVYTDYATQLKEHEERRADKIRRMQEFARKYEDLAGKMNQPRSLEIYAPGYGLLPPNASFVYDESREPPKNSYGLGERDRGGLWLMDAKNFEGASGYITVSDTEDEWEEEEGWQSQMRADLVIEERSKRRQTGSQEEASQVSRDGTEREGVEESSDDEPPAK